MEVSVPARAGLVGNPSDLYGGAVLAVPVRAFAARVKVTAAATTRIVGDDDGRALVEAALRRSHHHTGQPVEVCWSTDIPRSVGLAGSSAIVIATLKAVAALEDATIDVLALAQLALSVERDDLGIVAGLQDRAVQAADAPVLVDVSGPKPVIMTLSPARTLRIAVAWSSSAASDSGGYHAEVRARGTADEEGMRRLAELAREAAQAFAAGDAAGLQSLMSASAAERARVAPLSAAHDDLAAAVARAGLVPNSTGSGGAVAAVVIDDGALKVLPAELAALGGSFVVEDYPA